jgi:hypothetical protein
MALAQEELDLVEIQTTVQTRFETWAAMFEDPDRQSLGLPSRRQEPVEPITVFFQQRQHVLAAPSAFAGVVEVAMDGDEFVRDCRLPEQSDRHQDIPMEQRSAHRSSAQLLESAPPTFSSFSEITQ